MLGNIVKKKSYVRINSTIPPVWRDLLKETAAENDVSVSKIMRLALKNYVPKLKDIQTGSIQ